MRWVFALASAFGIAVASPAVIAQEETPGAAAEITPAEVLEKAIERTSGRDGFEIEGTVVIDPEIDDDGVRAVVERMIRAEKPFAGSFRARVSPSQGRSHIKTADAEIFRDGETLLKKEKGKWSRVKPEAKGIDMFAREITGLLDLEGMKRHLLDRESAGMEEVKLGDRAYRVIHVKIAKRLLGARDGESDVGRSVILGIEADFYVAADGLLHRIDVAVIKTGYFGPVIHWGPRRTNPKWWTGTGEPIVPFKYSLTLTGFVRGGIEFPREAQEEY